MAFDPKPWYALYPQHRGHRLLGVPVVDLNNRAMCLDCKVELTAMMMTFLTAPPLPPIPDGHCQTCGDAGEWRALALMCRNGHGKICG